MTAQEIIDALGLVPLAGEGGWHKELWRAGDDKGLSCIYYLLQKGEVSRWHKLHTSNEVWTWCAGGSMEMTLGGGGEKPVPGERRVFGPRVGVDDGFWAVAPAGVWQTTRLADGDWALVTCAVGPAFRPEDCLLPLPPTEDTQ